MADLLEVLVHGPGVGMGQDESGADIALGAHGAEGLPAALSGNAALTSSAKFF